MKVKYVSTVDWRWNQDILRANPLFHGQERYDYALIKVGTEDSNEAIFVQILHIFCLNFRLTQTPLALVLPFDGSCRPIDRRRDDRLRLTRVQARPRSSAVVISTLSIIRGGLLAKDPSSPNSMFVVEFVDEDMWTRMKKTKLVENARL